jgi:hypothetical protein
MLNCPSVLFLISPKLTSLYCAMHYALFSLGKAHGSGLSWKYNSTMFHIQNFFVLFIADFRESNYEFKLF